MQFENVVLESIATHLPEEIWTSESLEQRVEDVYKRFRVRVGRLELMTGIRERRVFSESYLPSVESANAGRKVLERSRISKENIEMLAHTGVCRDKLEPATAAYVHQALGLSTGTQFFDISNACLGFTNAMILAASMIESGQIETALITTSESSRQLLENTINAVKRPEITRKTLKQYFANFTIGSAAVAAVITHRKHAPDALRFVGAVASADSSHNTLCEGGGNQGAHEMLTDSEALLNAGISLAKKNWDRFQQELGWSDNTVNHYLCHQVGKMHQNALYDGLKIDKSKDFSTYQTLGNTGSAALPVTLGTAIAENRFQKGDKAALLGIGSGISSVMLGLQW